jgi:hypothetical protein
MSKGVIKKMKSIRVFTLLIFMVSMFVLVGCQNQKSATLTLKNEGEVMASLSKLEKNEVVSLPIPSADNQVFIGWSDGTTTYFDTYTFTDSTILTAVYKPVNDMFTYTVIPSREFSDAFSYELVRIDTYKGDVDRLAVPAMIDGKHVSAIGSNAFAGSSVIDVKLPVDIVIGDLAFSNILSLKSVTFYGDYVIPYEVSYNQSQWDELLSIYTSTCQFKGGELENQPYPYGEQCPILEVLNQRSMVIGGNTVTSYTALINPNIIYKPIRMTFSNSAFSGSIHLKTLEIPKGETQFNPYIVSGLNELENLVITDNHAKYRWQDGVLFNRDLNQMIYYPSYLQQTSYTLPSGLNNMPVNIENDYLETLVIPADFTGDLMFEGLHGLKEILVETGNTRYQSIDGVLYTNNSLIKYPANKAGAEFTVPSFVINIHDRAFSNNRNLETLILPDTLTHIDYEAFYKTEKLERLALPASVLTIGYGALNLSSIQTLIIHRSAIIQGTLTTIAGSLAQTYSTNFVIYVPDDSLNAYQSAPGYMPLAEVILPISAKN